MRYGFTSIAKFALDLLFPSQCLGCGTFGSYLCSSCEKASPRLSPPYCLICAKPIPSGTQCGECSSTSPPIDGIRAPYLMEGAIREAIHALKYRNHRAAAPTLGGLLANWIETTHVSGDILVPVPLHKRRIRERGYNQSALLAKEVGNRTGLAISEDVVIRTRNAPPQISLSYVERIRNVEGSFECMGSVREQKIILVDDVVTTGSTMSACASALKAGGAKTVWSVALAREGHR